MRLRARKGSSEARLKVFSFRVTDEEEALIEKAFRDSKHLSYQDYLREVVMADAANR